MLMTAADAVLPRQRQSSRIPLEAKLTYTLFVCIPVAIYPRYWALASFLYERWKRPRIVL